jgi:hypothetical protein
MKIGQKFRIGSAGYEVTHSHPSRASVFARNVENGEVVWFIEDELPLETIIL